MPQPTTAARVRPADLEEEIRRLRAESVNPSEEIENLRTRTGVAKAQGGEALNKERVRCLKII